MVESAIISSGVFIHFKKYDVPIIPITVTAILVTMENAYAVCNPTCSLFSSLDP